MYEYCLQSKLGKMEDLPGKLCRNPDVRAENTQWVLVGLILHAPMESKEVASVCIPCLDKQQMKKDVGSVGVGAFGDTRVTLALSPSGLSRQAHHRGAAFGAHNLGFHSLGEPGLNGQRGGS